MLSKTAKAETADPRADVLSKIRLPKKTNSTALKFKVEDHYKMAMSTATLEKVVKMNEDGMYSSIVSLVSRRF